MSSPLLAISIVGARPNFVKVAPVARALGSGGAFRHAIVHTGQHYEADMSERFFADLEIPAPDVHLGVGSGSHGEQTARMLSGVEGVLLARRPDLVLVYGDVNSTLAGALAAAKLGIPVCHVEAGLRSRDRKMPEEMNRILVDQLSEVLFTHSREAEANLAAEGIPRERVRFVGNVMIDSLLRCRERAEALAAWKGHGLAREGYGLVTLHRPSNVDEPERLASVLRALGDIARRIPLVYPVHPRTRDRLEAAGLAGTNGRLALVPPAGYVEFLSLECGARFVLTDSGGVQEETTALGIPCLTLRESTERPITVEEGTNRLVDLAGIDREVEGVLASTARRLAPPELWDGRAAERIASVLAERFRP